MRTVVTKLKRGALAGLTCLLLWQGAALGAEAWLAEFESTCAKTNDAMELSTQELSLLIESCTRLQKVIETQEESLRKVYSKRLQLCKNLYVYVLDYKKNRQQSP